MHIDMHTYIYICTHVFVQRIPQVFGSSGGWEEVWERDEGELRGEGRRAGRCRRCDRCRRAATVAMVAVAAGAAVATAAAAAAAAVDVRSLQAICKRSNF